MLQYLIFNSSHDTQGGPYDFRKAYGSLEEALVYGMDLKADYVASDALFRIARFDEKTMEHIYTLNIPDTECDRTGKLEWLAE